MFELCNDFGWQVLAAVPAADFGQNSGHLTLSNKGGLVESRSNSALSNQMIGFLSLQMYILFRKSISDQL